jgi:hypothetical protein
VWANHCDHRQSLIMSNDGGVSLNAIFIDNGHLFGGPYWSRKSRSGEALCLNSKLYTEKWTSEAIEGWVAHFETRLAPILANIIQVVPRVWYSGNIGELVESLKFRLENLRAIFSEERMNSRASPNRVRVDAENAELSLYRFELPQYGTLEERTASRLAYGI